MFREIQNKISDLFNTHNYLLDTIQGITARKFQSILDCEDRHFQSSLQFLSQLLKKYHDSPCIVLIDEYDAPLECAFTNNSEDPNHEGFDFLKKAKTFFGTLFSGLLKSNDANIYKALLVGVLRVAQSGVLSGLNNLSVYPMFDSRYGDKFGFTQEEVKALIENHPVEHDFTTIANWYDSYSAGNGLCLLFNPWSVISLWSSSSIKELLWCADVEFQNKVDRLINGESIDITIHHDISYETLRNSVEKSLWSLLYYSGYLTIGYQADRVEDMEVDQVDEVYSTRIPNREVLMEWKGWFSNLLKSEKSTLSLLNLLLAGDGQRFSTTLPNILASSLNYYTVEGKKAESFYHAFFIGLFIHARSRHCEVHSELPAGDGRFDFSLFPHQSSSFYTVIVEFKVVGKNYGLTLEEAASTGLQQISNKNYRAAIPRYATKLMEVGIAFEGNSLQVKFSKFVRAEDFSWQKD